MSVPVQPVIRHMKGLPHDLFSAEGLMYQDWHAVTPCQRAVTTRVGLEIQREQEEYIHRHPEILAMLKIFIAKITKKTGRMDPLKAAALHFTRPIEELDEEIRTFLESPEEGPYVNLDTRKLYEVDDLDFIADINKIILEHHPIEPWVFESPHRSIVNTPSSSFVSLITSENTLPTPVPIPTPELTISQIFYNLISQTVDKVIYTKVDESVINYDTAYVELMKAVEQAMEVPVIEIRIDIADLFTAAYRMFEINIMEKEAYAAEIAWQRRMRKKLKKSLRRQKNFKGYETPPKSQNSSHESYKRPPPRPCECQSLAQYNRYGKDRFGIYLPRKKEDQYKKNITTTPDCQSVTALNTENDGKAGSQA